MITQQNFPQIASPFVDPASGLINQVWLQLLIALWNRTGGASGDILDQSVYTTQAASEDPHELTAHSNLWSANQYFNAGSGIATIFKNTNLLTANSFSTGWFSNSTIPGNFIFNSGRTLLGEAIVNAGKSTSNGEWVETLSGSTVIIAQTASINRAGGIGFLAGSRTSESPDVGASFNQGTQGVTSVVYNDNTSSLQTCYGIYAEAWKSATAKAENITHVAELTNINMYASTATTDPYNASPSSLTETLRVATGKGSSGNTTSTGICIVSTGTNAAFENGIIVASNALTTDNRAISLAKGHLIAWFRPDRSGGSHIRSDVNTGELGYRIAFGDGTINFQDESNSSLWTFGTPPNPDVIVNQYCVEFHGVLALLTSNQTTTDGTDTKVSFNSTDYDTDGFWSIGTPTRVTIPSSLNGRKVIVSMNLVYDLSDVSIRVAQIFKNGTGVYPGRGSAYAGTGSPAQGTSLNCSTAAITVSTGDYFEVQATQYTGGNLDIVADRTWIALEVVA